MAGILVRPIDPAEFATSLQVFQSFPPEITGLNPILHLNAVDKTTGVRVGLLGSVADSLLSPDPAKPRLHIEVTESRRTQGVGTALLAEFEHLMLVNGARTIRARIDSKEEAAIAFLKRRGFAEHHRMGSFELHPEKAQDLSDQGERDLETDGITIRAYGPGQLSESEFASHLELYNAASGTQPPHYDDPFVPDDGSLLKPMLSMPDSLPFRLFVAWHGGKAVASSSFHASGRHSQTLQLILTIVAPEYRNRGIAQALRTKEVLLARDLGLTRIRDYVRLDNPASIRVNEKLGFKLKDSQIRFWKQLIG